MGVLANTRGSTAAKVPGRWIMIPPEPNGGPRTRRSRVVRRRRQNFERLVVAAGVTLVLSALPFLRALFMLHVACDVALVLYALQLRHWRRIEVQRRRVVRQLPTAASPEPSSSIEVVFSTPEDDDVMLASHFG